MSRVATANLNRVRVATYLMILMSGWQTIPLFVNVRSESLILAMLHCHHGVAGRQVGPA